MASYQALFETGSRRDYKSKGYRLLEGASGKPLELVSTWH